MEIRKAKLSDCKACEDLSQRCKELTNVNGQSNYYLWFVKFIKAKQIVLVAKDRGKIIGFVAGEVNTGYSLMQLLAVDDKYRGNGIGGRLIKEFEKVSLRRGIRHILLYGYKDRSDFFRRQGYIRRSPCFEFMKIIASF